MKNFQRTLKRPVLFSGVALHSGDTVHVEIRPACAGTGIIFQRTDLKGSPYIKASPEQVFDTSLATRIGTREAYVSTIEHLMAAFFGFGIDNAVVALDNCEMPILDGSAAPFLVLLDEAGILELKEPRKVLVIREPIEVIDENNPSRFIRIEPSKKPLISYVVDYAGSIGKQQISMDYNAWTFCEEFSYARTFCLKEEIEYMHSKGLAKGGSMENAIVFSKQQGLLNAQGLRNEFEFVKHKALDCIGDLYLLGAPILGHVIAHKAGHDLHNKLSLLIQNQVKSRKIFVPNAKEVLAPGFQNLLSFPKSLSDINRSLVGLAIG
ncbi:MAG: UDP-3-O-acyl-N-acetylglucosamine deacetylase [Bdellovibrionota bacterium]